MATDGLFMSGTPGIDQFLGGAVVGTGRWIGASPLGARNIGHRGPCIFRNVGGRDSVACVKKG